MRVRLIIAIACVIVLSSCHQNNPSVSNMPIPTETTIKWDMEDGDKKSEREKYIDLVHGGKESNWRQIEVQNMFDQLEIKKALREYNANERSEEEWVAEGNLKGKWIERGSTNQAGNITNTAYDRDNDMIYCRGGGGPIFKGTRFGSNWELVNDDIRFSEGLLQIIDNEKGERRLIAAINQIPYYSDDGGDNWERSNGLSSNGGDISHQLITSEQDIFFLHKYDYWSDIKLVKSEDYGTRWRTVHQFSTNDVRNVALRKDISSDEIFLIEQLGANKSRLFKYNTDSGLLTNINPNVNLGFGDNGRANLLVNADDTLRLYSYDEEENFYESVDTGKIWQRLSKLPTRPWAVGVFMPTSDPTKLMYGEVNSYRTLNGGKNWFLINEWWEYYGNVEYKLHADIMCIDEYFDPEGNPFVLIGNHGGVSLTTDYGKTNQNIGMFDLNVGQFYDVKSYPPNSDRFFGGTQDQGLQKGKTRGDDPDDFVQIISGDYGHLQFTGPDRSHMWTVYPGGSIGFYSNPLSQNGPEAGYEIDSQNETVWIPPIIPSADPTKDIVFAAGGSVNSSSDGSYILKLEWNGTKITSAQLPFDFSVSDGQISAMAISPFDPNTWWVATTNGYLYMSEDGAQTFNLIRKTVSSSHYLYGSCILPSKLDPNVVYLSGNGYNGASPVYKSTDKGKTWKSLSKYLPQTTVFNLALNGDESLLFAATEAGPYVYLLDQDRWYYAGGESTPNQTFWSVEFVEDKNLARFSTFGRGIWDFEVTSQDPTNTIEIKETEVVIYPNPTYDIVTVRGDNINDVIVLDDKGSRIKMITSKNVESTRIDVSDLVPGLYFIKVNDEIIKMIKI